MPTITVELTVVVVIKLSVTATSPFHFYLIRLPLATVKCISNVGCFAAAASEHGLFVAIAVVVVKVEMLPTALTEGKPACLPCHLPSRMIVNVMSGKLVVSTQLMIKELVAMVTTHWLMTDKLAATIVALLAIAVLQQNLQKGADNAVAMTEESKHGLHTVSYGPT